MHTMEMSDADAMALMTQQAFQTEAEAKGKLKRAKLTSCQLPTYYAGIRDWWALRRAYEKKAGSSFNLRKFHDAALAYGPLPLPMIEAEMVK
jgi:uncharacterized protein (DUF885 family)